MNPLSLAHSHACLLMHISANNWHGKKLAYTSATHTTLYNSLIGNDNQIKYIMPFKSKTFRYRCALPNWYQRTHLDDNNSNTHIIKQNDLDRESKQRSRFDINATNMRERMHTHTHIDTQWNKPSLWGRRQQKPHLKKHTQQLQINVGEK